MPGRESRFRRLYLNQWGPAAALRWLSLSAWDACRASEPATAAGRQAFLGLDLSTTTDLTALVVLRPARATATTIRAEFWCPADQIAEREPAGRVPYELWARQGFLTATHGNTVDYSSSERA